MLRIVKTVSLLALILIAVPPPAIQSDVSRRPNIVFIMADDLGYGELGCYGQEKIKTPRIDALAREGLRFTDYYAGSTVCAPSRSVLMTGQHTGRTWVRGNGAGAAQALRPSDVTVAELLKSVGYVTGITGKWGLGDTTPGAEVGLPNRQGFDFFYGYFNQAHAHNYWPPFLFENEERVELPNVGDFRPNGSGVATEKRVYAPDRILDQSVRFIAKHRNDPFFLYLSWTLPHANNEANRAVGEGSEVPDLGEYANRNWPLQARSHAAMVTYLDTQVGKVLAALDEHKLRENTLVFFTSDNGAHRESGHNPEFFNASGKVRGIKRSLYDGGIRVPMIARWPNRIMGNSVTNHIAYHGDLMATLGALVNKPIPADLNSVNFLPTLLGDTKSQQKHAYLYWEFYEGGGRQALRQGNWKAVRQPMFTGPLELYDLDRDPQELQNVAAQQPELATKISELMQVAHVPNPNWKVARPANECDLD